VLKNLNEQQQFFKKSSTEGVASSKVSFQICSEISAAGKCFTEIDFVKICLLIAVSGLCPYKKVYSPCLGYVLIKKCIRCVWAMSL
jgi:hypothetical protein